MTAPDVVVRDVDWTVWVPAPPPPWVAEHPQPDEVWAAEYAQRVIDRAGRRPRGGELETVRQQLLLTGRRTHPGPETAWVWKALHVPVPLVDAVPAVVAVLPAQGDAEADLRAMARVDDPTLVEPAVVDDVLTPLGPGLRSLAYVSAPTRDGGSELVATLTFAWRVDGAEGPRNVRLWFSWTPSRVVASAGDVERLALCLHPGGPA